MAHPFHHAESTVRKFGGAPEDYLEIHSWFDATKAWFADWKHRAFRHHSEGIFEMEKVFGAYIINSEGKIIPTRLIGEQHVREDIGFIPTAKDWIVNLQSANWMRGVPKLDRPEDQEPKPHAKAAGESDPVSIA